MTWILYRRIYTGLCNTEPPLPAQPLRMVLFHHREHLSVLSLVCHSQYTDNNGHGFVQRLLRSLLLVSIKEQASNKFILFDISPVATKTVLFVYSQELRNWWLILLAFLLAFNSPSPPSSAVHLLDSNGVYHIIQTLYFEHVWWATPSFITAEQVNHTNPCWN